MTNYLCKNDLRDSTTKGHPINDPAYEPISIRKTSAKEGAGKGMPEGFGRV